MAVDLVPDYEGLGEARIEHGTGTVKGVEYEEGKRNAKVTIDVAGLRHPLYGWADVNALPDVLTVPKGTPVDYRIVIHRKRGIDLARPIAELGNGEKIKDLVALRPAGSGAAAPPAQGAPGAPPASSGTTGPAQGPSGPQSAAQSMTSDAADVMARNHAEVERKADERRAQVEHRLAAESKPWELYNTDGRLNLGSYATLAVAGMVELAHTATLAARPGAVPLPSFVHTLAGALLGLADAVQYAGTGRIDRMATSHTRARGFVRSAVEAMPVPLDGDADERRAWREAVERHATELFRATVDLATRHAEGK